jgi:hypothetical protein
MQATHCIGYMVFLDVVRVALFAAPVGISLESRDSPARGQVASDVPRRWTVREREHGIPKRNKRAVHRRCGHRLPQAPECLGLPRRGLKRQSITNRVAEGGELFTLTSDALEPDKSCESRDCDDIAMLAYWATTTHDGSPRPSGEVDRVDRRTRAARADQEPVPRSVARPGGRHHGGAPRAAQSQAASEARASNAMRRTVIAGFTQRRPRLDLPKFEQFETERLDLLEDTEQRGSILDQTGEHGLAAFQLRHQRGKGGPSGYSEPAPYPDRVQARRCGHVVILQLGRVSRRHRNLVIVRTPVLALFRRWSGTSG